MPKTSPERLKWNKEWLAKKKAEDPDWAERRRIKQAEAQRRWRERNREEVRRSNREAKRAELRDPERAAHRNAVQLSRYHERWANDPEYREAVREKSREKYYRDKRRDPEGFARLQRVRLVRHRFGLSEGDLEALEASHNGKCGICGNPETHMKRGKVVALSIDHDAKTGEVRGLLCNGCNRGIGFLRHDPVALRAAANYVEGTNRLWRAT